ncbi:DEAD/DEAH box helicase [Gemmata sp. G18]|uniref:DEAD/DEAH box helicase n=1 Tax=Gemmata palustris TaxID=2822762 RepID=A0ABS5BKE1_9BACT|nr:DEAD/DEAH box helicase [Gemmata palustris]MBP3954168.1 DEAD/DEAH box helicase [Gemmata palustris]
MSLSTALSADVTPAIRERGREYFRSGAVTLDSVSATDVAATVEGSGDDYEVDLRLVDRTVYATCTCPYVADHEAACKHIWATVLAAESRAFARSARGSLRLVLDGYLDDFFDDDMPISTSLRFPPANRAPKPKPKPRETWTDLLAAVRREVQPVSPGAASNGRTADRQLVFVVDAPASEQARKLVLEINTQDRKINGEWGKPKPHTVSTSQRDTLPDPLDRQLLALLGGAERGDSYGYSYGYSYDYGYGVSRYRVGGPLLETVLPLLAQTDRVLFRRDPKPPVTLEPLAPDLDPPWVLTARVARASTGKQWALDGSLRRGTETMTLTQPALMVPGFIAWNGRFGRLDDAGAFPWVPTLRRAGAITVPAGKADDLVAQLLQMPTLPKLDLPEELRFTEEMVSPRPRLVVKPAKTHYGSAPVLHAELSFDYAGAIVPLQPTTRGVYKPDGRKFLLRDPGAERQAEAELTRLGVRYGWAAGAQTLEVKPSQLPKLVRELTTAGWIVEADGKLYRRAGDFKMELSTGRDWFDLSGAANFDGQSVTFPRLLEALQRGQTSVLLDDGSLGMVPEDWLKKYGLISQMGTVEGDAIRFSRTQVGVLDALLASRPEITFDKQFGRAREQLHKFQGIKPADPPKAFHGELREYQREGLGWLRFLREFGFGGCLADDMGLGKTVQVLALLAGKRSGPALVVVPRSLVFNWKQEAARFAPKLKVLDHTGTARDRTGANFKDFDLVLTTYGTLRNDAATFADVQFDTCILDESQAAKNAATETAKAVRVVRADHRLALSGTPVENHLGELWTLFDFLNPGMLGRAALTSGASSLRNPDAETREFLARALRPYILRRTKDQVAKDLPQKTEQTVYCDLEPAQRQLYDELRDHYRQSLLAHVDSVGLKRSQIQVLAALLRLRQAACHPGLIDKKRTAEGSAKLDVLLPQLQELAESGRKALVFSQFTSLLDIVRKRLTAEGIKFEYLDGRTRDRDKRVARFQTDPECRLFLVSLKAGGVGLNLTAAEYVFLLDPWWNPAVEAQAIDRSHRIGQTKPVFAYRLIARGTVEEKVLELQRSKRELADAILGGDGRLVTDLKREDLELLLS